MRKGLGWAFLLLSAGYSVEALQQITGGTRTAQGTGQAIVNADQNATSGANNAPIKVDFQDVQPIVSRWQGGTMHTINFFVRSDESTETTVSFAVILEDSEKRVVRPAVQIVSGTAATSSRSIPGNGMEEITLQIDETTNTAPLTGYLQMTASSPGRKAAYAYRALRVPPDLPSNLATCFFFACLFLSIGVTVVSLIWLKTKGVSWWQRMGPPAWNFGDSWGTNITVGGALVTTLLGFSALPEQTQYLNKTAYLCLSLIFAALITLAPSIFALLRTPVAIAGNPTPQYQGYVLPFALASGTTVWGALGQLGTVGLLLSELAKARQISGAVLDALISILGVVGVFLLIYAGRTIVQIAQSQGTAGGGKAGAPLPSWSVL